MPWQAADGTAITIVATRTPVSIYQSINVTKVYTRHAGNTRAGWDSVGMRG